MTLSRMCEVFLQTPPRIRAAMAARPELVGGTGSADTELMRARPGWIAKGGAEGLFCVVRRRPTRGRSRWRTARTARSRPALAGCSSIDAFREVEVHNSRGEVVGSIVMKVFIVSDMEGVAGIVKWQQRPGGHAMYEEGRRLYTGEINAAVRGAKAAGATEIVVMDCHGAGEGWTFNSLIPEELDPAASSSCRTSGRSTPTFLESGVDAALFVGMHAMAGTRDGVLAHTVSGSSWWRLRFNGVEVGETGINAALCGDVGLPGAARHRRRGVVPRGERAPRRWSDDRRREEGPRPLQRAAVPGAEGARADRGRRTRRARRPEGGARRTTRARRARSPSTSTRPTTSSGTATAPGVEITEPRQIVSRADDWWTAWKQFFF